MKHIRLLSVFLTAVLLFALLPTISVAETGVSAGDSFSYTQADHWGVENDLWSWQWALADTEDFQNMTFTTVEGQGECYVADWDLYPYCAARNGGINVHPNKIADAARVFTAPASGWVTVSASVARASAYTTPSSKSPTSFRIVLEETTVYPTEGDYQILTSTEAESITVQAFLKKGEKLRFIVGSMDNQTSDSVNLHTTVTYDTVVEAPAELCRVGETYTYAKTAETFGAEDPRWSWEWAPAGKTTFSPMTYQYVEKYSKYMYASDWTANPYNYVDSLGVKLHPAVTADTVKTFTVPFTGTVKLDTKVSRYVNLADVTTDGANGSSLRIFVNKTQVYPLYSAYIVLDSTTPKEFSLSLPVTAGDKIRIVIGGMGQVTSDAVRMYNTVTYTDTRTPEICVSDSETFSVNATQWANNDMGNWSFEWRDANDTFGDMTYQYVEHYGRYMYASDWAAHAYNYADLLGVKLHPAKNRDAVKTYTAPHDGRIQMNIRVLRSFEYAAEGSKNPTSLTIYKNNEQIWPTNGSQKELTSTEAFSFNVYADVRAGDKIRCVVGSMGNTTQDGIEMYNTVTYRAVGLRELAAVTDQYNQRIDVIDLHGDNLNSAETAWSWKPTTALGFSSLTTFNSPTDAKIRYNKSLHKYVIAVCSSRGFMGVVDFATGKKLWQVSVTDESNPHSIEYLPNGNVAVAASINDWIRVYTSSQGASSDKYVQVTLEGAHGVLWDPNRQILWGLGTEEITAYRIGGTAAAPTLTELTQYHAAFTDEIRSGHDLSPVYGNPNRLWISSKTVLQYDIPTASFVREYEQDDVLAHSSVKGISSFPDSNTTVHVYPNNTYLVHDSDRIFVTLPKDGKFFGITHSHATGAYYKVRSWISSYNSVHSIHRPLTLPATTPTCIDAGMTQGTICSVCGITMTPQESIPPLGHSYTDGICICGAKETILDESIKIYHTLDLASDISITFAVPVSALANYDSYYLECVLHEYDGNAQIGTSAVQIQPVLSGNYYYFTLTGITAVRMGDMVDAVLHMTKDGQKYISKTDSYSVSTYAYAMLNNSSDATMLTLCADLLRYGAEAQTFKKYRTDALVDAAMTEAHKAYLSDTNALRFTATDSYLGDLANPTITWVGKTLDLGSKVGMKFVFNASNYSGDVANLSMKVSYTGSTGETKAVTLTGAEVYSAANSYYSFTFYGLLASELRTIVDVAIYEGGTQLSETLHYSAESYASKTVGTALETLTRALFAYSDSAKNFFTK